MRSDKRLTIGLVVVATTIGVAQGPGSPVAISGELRQWHKITLTLDGPEATETAQDRIRFATIG
jgi:hypothetical protein